MALEISLRMFEARAILDKTSVAGSGDEMFRVLTGARILLTLQVIAIDPGTSISLFIDNTFGLSDSFETLATMTRGSIGRTKKTLGEFNNIFRIRYVVTGGSVTFKLVAALFDNASVVNVLNDPESIDGGEAATVFGGTIDGGGA